MSVLLSGVACFAVVHLLSATSNNATLAVLWVAVFISATFAAYNILVWVIASLFLFVLTVDLRSPFVHRLLSHQPPRLSRRVAFTIGLVLCGCNLLLGGLTGSVIALSFLSPHHVVALENDPVRFSWYMTLWSVLFLVGALGLAIEFGLSSLKKRMPNDP